MTRRNALRCLAAAGLLCLAGAPAIAQQADTKAIDGVWEGPWYRGMSSGIARFEIGDGAGSMRLTNAESFGEGDHPLSKVTFDGKAFGFEVRGGGGPMTALLKLTDKGDQMKGMGKYEGFGVRFELTRVR